MLANLVELADATAFDVDALDRERTCVCLAVSPIEEHGPHLPLGTDVIEADGVLRRMVRRLATERPEWTFALYPPIPLGSGCFHYPGSASVRPSVIADAVEDIVCSLAEGGFRFFIVSSHHGSPSHNLALERAARRVRRRTRGRAALLSLAGRTIVDLYLQGGLAAHHDRMGDDGATRKALAVDCHAGAFETAEMLVLRPDLVRDYKDLPPVLVPLHRLTRRSGLCEAEALGYFGAPGIADAERGGRYLDFIVERALPDVRSFLDGKKVPGRGLKWRAALGALEAWAGVRGRLQWGTSLRNQTRKSSPSRTKSTTM